MSQTSYETYAIHCSLWSIHIIIITTVPKKMNGHSTIELCNFLDHDDGSLSMYLVAYKVPKYSLSAKYKYRAE